MKRIPRPDHKEGTLTYPDGITWTMSQDTNICHSCGVRNVVFRDIRLQNVTCDHPDSVVVAPRRPVKVVHAR